MSQDPSRREIAVVILAAGKGKRMGNPDLAKVLVPLKGTPLVGHVLQTVKGLDCERVVAIVGHQREAVADYVKSVTPTARIAIQEEQLGTGHAVQQTEQALADFSGDVVILSGDVPLLSTDTLTMLIKDHQSSGAALTVLTTRVPDPTGYGRIVRTSDDHLARIVEHKDASDAELPIDEINSGIYVVDRATLFDALSQVRNDNRQQEYYLTDIAGILNDGGQRVNIFLADDWHEVHGINTPADLDYADEILSIREGA